MLALLGAGFVLVIGVYHRFVWDIEYVCSDQLPAAISQVRRLDQAAEIHREAIAFVAGTVAADVEVDVIADVAGDRDGAPAASRDAARRGGRSRAGGPLALERCGT